MGNQHDKKFVCIYCKGVPPSVEPSVSDIIPYALMGGKKFTLNNKVCKSCNNRINTEVENKIISDLVLFRRRLQLKKRRGGKIPSEYKLSITENGKQFDTKPFKHSGMPETILDSERYLFSKDGEARAFGPKKLIDDNRSRRKKFVKTYPFNPSKGVVSVYETFVLRPDVFFSLEMQRMVAKICFEWFILECHEVDPLSSDYDAVRDAILHGDIEGKCIVDIVTKTSIAKSLFFTIEKTSDKESEFFVQPNKLLIGNHYLFFQIKKQVLHCFFAFMGG